MRKMLAALLCLLLVMTSSAALADQWGTSGEMSAFLKRSGDYDDVKYPQLSSGYSPKSPFSFFTVNKDDEYLLVVLRRNEKGDFVEVGRYPGALKEVNGGQDKEFWKRSTEDGIHLKNMWSKTDEEYDFAWNGQEMVLRYANTGSLTFTQREDGEGYTVNDGWQDLRWLSRPLTLAEFRMDMLPQSGAEVLLGEMQLTYHHALLDYEQRVRVDAGKNKTLPVYAAPSELAWRGANGKAAVSLSQPFDVLAEYPDGWRMIEYEISRSERRIGFVQGLENVSAQELHLIGSLETLAVNTVVTDDPHGTRREMFTLAAGTEVEALGCLDANWQCIQTYVDGKLAWGFIPINAVMVAEKYQQRDIMAQLQGAWRTTGGGQLLGDGVIFGEDGSLTICIAQDDETFPPAALVPYERVAAWCVCDPWDGEHPWLVVWPWEGVPSVYEIVIGEDTFQVFWGEAGGAYQRFEQP